MDAVIVLLILLFVLLAIGVPVGFAIGGATMISMFFFSDLNMVVNAQYCYSGIFSFTVMAIPYFMLAGTIMSTGGIARRIVDFASALIDFVTGALGCVSMLACMFFGALTGSGMATTSAIGGMMIPEMKRKGYDSSYAATLVCFGGIVGPIIPPSLSFVLYGASTKTSVPDLFKAGIIPGVMIGLVFLMVNIIICKRTGTEVHKPELGPGGERIPMIQFWKERLHRVGKATKDGFWALLSPFIILGGIYSGFFTPTEAAAVAAVYALICGLFIYREINLKNLFSTIANACSTNGTTMVIIGCATAFTRILTLEQIPALVSNALIGISDNPIVILLLINLLLLFVGCFMDTTPAMMVLSPILLPVALEMGLSAVHFGIIMVVNLAIGFITPPLGINLFVAARVGNTSLEVVCKGIVRFILVMIVCLLLITYIPAISEVLPRMTGMLK